MLNSAIVSSLNNVTILGYNKELAPRLACLPSGQVRRECNGGFLERSSACHELLGLLSLALRKIKSKIKKEKEICKHR